MDSIGNDMSWLKCTSPTFSIIFFLVSKSTSAISGIIPGVSLFFLATLLFCAGFCRYMYITKRLMNASSICLLISRRRNLYSWYPKCRSATEYSFFFICVLDSITFFNLLCFLASNVVISSGSDIGRSSGLYSPICILHK